MQVTAEDNGDNTEFELFTEEAELKEDQDQNESEEARETESDQKPDSEKVSSSFVEVEEGTEHENLREEKKDNDIEVSGQDPENTQVDEETDSEQVSTVLNEDHEEDEVVLFESDSDTSNLVISSDDQDLQYWTGERANLRASLDVSSLEEAQDGAYLEIKFPKTYIDEVIASDINLQESKIIKSKNGHKIIRYNLKRITGGLQVEIPFAIVTNNGETPDGYTLPIVATLFNQDGNVINESDEVEISYKVGDSSLEKSVQTSFGSLEVFESRDGVEIYGLGLDPNDPGRLKPNSTEFVGFQFRMNASGSTRPNGTGARYYESITIIDTLPDGAVFVQEENPDWIYDEDNHTVSFTSPEGRYQLPGALTVVPRLNLKFPGQKIRTDVTNSAEITAVPYNSPNEYNEPDLIRSDSITFQFGDRPKGPLFQKIVKDGRPGFPDAPEPRMILDLSREKTEEFTYNIRMRNESSTNMKNIEIRDFNLDDRFRFNRLEFPSNSMFEGEFSITAIKEDGTSELVVTNEEMPSEGILSIDLPENTKEFVFNSLEDAYLMQTLALFEMSVVVEMRDPEAVSFVEDADTNRLWNYAELTTGFEGLPEDLIMTEKDQDYFFLTPYDPMVEVKKNRFGGNETRFLGDEVGYRIDVYSPAENAVHPDDLIEAQYILDLLPLGVEYVQGSSRIAYSQDHPEKEKDYLWSVPNVIENYKDTGRTALKWTFTESIPGNLTPGIDSDGERMEYFTISYQTKITALAKEGTNRNDVYMIWDNNDEIKPVNSKADSMDIDGDGDTEERVAHAQATFSYTAPRETVIIKRVKGSLDQTFVSNPNSGLMAPGGTGLYELVIFNNNSNDREISSFTLIDALPTVGDRRLVENNAGSLLDRNSQFPVLLDGPVEVPTNFTVYYNTEYPDGEAVVYENQSGWSTEVTDYSKIKGIKITLDEDSRIEAGEMIRIEVPIIVEDTGDLTFNDEAVNSFAISTDQASYFESNFVSLRVRPESSNPDLTVEKSAVVETVDANQSPGGTRPPPGAPGLGEISKDSYTETGEIVRYTVKAKNKGDSILYHVGITDEKEDLFNVNYQMFNADGMATNEMVTNGMVTLEPGQYLQMTASYTVTSEDIEAGLITNVASAEAFPELGGNPIEDLDEAIVYGPPSPSISLDKTADLTTSVVGEEVRYTFTVTNTGNVSLLETSITDPLEGLSDITYLTLDGEEITSTDSITLKPEQVLVAEATYTVTEQDLENREIINTAQVSAEDDEGTVVEDEDTVIVEVLASKASVILTKVNEEGAYLEGAEFDLRDEDDEVISSSNVTDEDGQIEIDGLPDGNYSFVETAAPEGYILDGTPITFTLNAANEQLVELEVVNVREESSPELPETEEPPGPSAPGPVTPPSEDDEGTEEVPESEENPGGEEEVESGPVPDGGENPGSGTGVGPGMPSQPSTPDEEETPEVDENPGIDEETEAGGRPGDEENPQENEQPGDEGSAIPESSDPDHSESSEEDRDQEVVNKQPPSQILPQTGAVTNWIMIVAGLLLLVFGAGIIGTKNRSASNKQM